MDHALVDWHDIAAHHDCEADVALRRVFKCPVATKQCSISAAHTGQMIDETLAHLAHAIAQPVTR